VPAQPLNCQSGISELLGHFTGATSTTMSLEPGIIDANVLVYAMDADFNVFPELVVVIP
jgi:hypothetical protein